MRRYFWFFILTFALAATGCGPKLSKVSGRLLKDGAPQSFDEDQYVTVSFRPEKVGDEEGSDTYPATINRSAGTYEVELPPGTYFVNILVPPKGFEVPDSSSGKPAKPIPPPAGDLAGGKKYEIKSSMTLDLPIP